MVGLYPISVRGGHDVRKKFGSEKKEEAVARQSAEARTHHAPEGRDQAQAGRRKRPAQAHHVAMAGKYTVLDLRVRRKYELPQ